MAPDPAVARVNRGGFRYANYDTPFWSRPNTLPGRWHLPGDGPTQYLSLSPAGAWAELIRHEELRTEDEVAHVRTKLWVVELNAGNLADYGNFEQARAAGFDPDALVDEDYGRCQREGARLRSRGYGGVVAPSAALPGAINVTLFGARYSIRWMVQPVTASAIPAAVAAVGAPPPGIVARVRHHGDRHESLHHYSLANNAKHERVRSRRKPRESE
jgi:RES domain